MEWRHLRPGEFDHEKLWLAVGLALTLGCWIFLQTGLPAPKCTFHQVTGFPCPGCGATRCVRALAAGDPGHAAAMNPLFFVLMAFWAVYACYAAAVLLFRLPRFRMKPGPAWLGWTVRIGAVAALLLNWTWLILDKR